MICGVMRAILALLARALAPALLPAPIVHGDRRRVQISSSAIVNNTIFNMTSGTITVEDHAFFGHNVSPLTRTHECRVRGAARLRAVPSSGRDITIGKGAWIASRIAVIGPYAIGDDVVVAAGSVVTSDVRREDRRGRSRTAIGSA